MSLVPTRYDVTDPDRLEQGLSAAVTAVRRGDLIVLPTDTVYGLGADAFDPDSVAKLLAAKGRGRDMPPPVLVAAASTLDALGTRIPEWCRDLTEEYWPGPLTVVVRQQASLQWDLGETRGTVAVRMPDEAVAIELLGRTGPLAVSSANLTGRPAATTAQEAEEMLGDAVEVILDAGPSRGAVVSTIVDCTGAGPRILREGAITAEAIRTLLGPQVDVEVTEPGA